MITASSAVISKVDGTDRSLLSVIVLSVTEASHLLVSEGGSCVRCFSLVLSPLITTHGFTIYRCVVALRACLYALIYMRTYIRLYTRMHVCFHVYLCQFGWFSVLPTCLLAFVSV